MTDYVVLHLVPNQQDGSPTFEPIERKMYERVSLKLGRHVKSPQEKAEAATSNAASIAQAALTPSSSQAVTTPSHAGRTSSVQIWTPGTHSSDNNSSQENEGFGTFTATGQHGGPSNDHSPRSPFDHARAFFLGSVGSHPKTTHAATASVTSKAATPANNESTLVTSEAVHESNASRVEMALSATIPAISPSDVTRGSVKATLPPLPIQTVETAWFKSKVVSRIHAEIWNKDGQLYLKDIGSSSGTFLNKMRLSPASKVSRPYPIRAGDVIQLGVDYQGRTEDIYKAVEIKVLVELQTASTTTKKRNSAARFRSALKALLTATNPYSTSHTVKKDKSQSSEKTHDHSGSVDCCICLSSIGPYQALFIAPCSHCYHYKCIRHVLKDSLMFPCPVCRQVANLDASVSMESLFDYDKESHHFTNNNEDKNSDSESDPSSDESVENGPSTKNVDPDETIEMDTAGMEPNSKAVDSNFLQHQQSSSIHSQQSLPEGKRDVEDFRPILLFGQKPSTNGMPFLGINTPFTVNGASFQNATHYHRDNRVSSSSSAQFTLPDDRAVPSMFGSDKMTSELLGMSQQGQTIPHTGLSGSVGNMSTSYNH
ncbi:hypothetical protein BDEG_26038 [Batrachochytrium dendrobatidis JEL423]|uniref:FHA domain-containing protein n=1 Tax=Batrachochytrium dendrobatidis (strain JEL423) TaxID=403673 RepID=A0A177WR48_BATDL|nr:hypothetical protein BDEG_26038 [Batrachochytrium dendrobatidis JEL423]